jgi:hypothetical protein
MKAIARKLPPRLGSVNDAFLLSEDSVSLSVFRTGFAWRRGTPETHTNGGFPCFIPASLLPDHAYNKSVVISPKVTFPKEVYVER